MNCCGFKIQTKTLPLAPYRYLQLLTQPGGGGGEGGGGLCAPGTLPEVSPARLELDLKLSDKLNDVILKQKIDSRLCTPTHTGP